METAGCWSQLGLVMWRQVWLARVRRHYLVTLLELSCMLFLLSSVWEESVAPYRARPNKDQFFDSADAIEFWGRPNESWSEGSLAFAPNQPFFADLAARVCKALGPKWRNNQLVVTGDFNAAHMSWGYAYSNPRGNKLYALIDEHDLSLVTDPKTVTRIGTSVTRDTAPDPTFTRKIPRTTWNHLDEYLGSDHAILATTIAGRDYSVRAGQARLTDWTSFRKKARWQIKRY
ncbi:hypothetical protein HPB49_005536 [Dermacentor silvarum]|uniref:Uncharacterized protein n=1 Tax=Dermacentor silvarum TaxID=543639 RepID=A0ACB8DIJ8_DERSI|nr:hypothetical protein HPB49_005536 [Dermacentor silvarum]